MRVRAAGPLRSWREVREPLRRTLGLLRPHLPGNRRLCAGGVAALLLEVAVRLAEPWPVKVVLDAVIPAALGEATPGRLPGLLLAAGAAVLVLAVLRAAAAYLSTVAFALAGARMTTALRERVYQRLLAASPRFHAGARTGDLVTRVVGDVGRVQEAAISAGMPLVGNLLTFAGMLAVMLVLDPLLALAVLAVVPLSVLQGGSASGRISGASRAMRRREGQLAGDAGEAFGAVPVVQAYGLQVTLGERFRVANTAGLSEGIKARRLAAGLERRTDVVVGVATAVVLVLGAQRVLAQAITPGELVVFLTYLKTAFKPLRDLAKHVGRISRAVASGERVADAMDRAAPLPDRSWARPLTRAVGEVRLEGVVAGHDPERPVLRGADLVVHPGEVVAVVGASGAGKSTLLQLLLRSVDPVQGRYRLDGHDTVDLTRRSVRDATAVVLQDSVLFAVSVRENVRYGRAGADDAAVEAAVRAAGAHDFVEALPQGYDTVLGERGATLSGGQRQRLAIARAVLRDPALLLLDEPTTGLDEVSRRTVMEALQRVARGRTTVLVTHDPALLGWCDRVFTLRDGRFVEDAARPGRRPGGRGVRRGDRSAG